MNAKDEFFSDKEVKTMKFGGLQKLTLLDYPSKVACTVFTVGCNLRCPFCHNAGMVLGNNCEQLSQEDVLSFLKKRRNLLEGMCLTGGEPLLQSGVEDFLREVKDLGYCVKLDTNGTYFEKLQNLVEKKLVDYVAMDVKNSKECYAQTVGGNVDMDAVCRSVEYLKSGVVDYEFRTTVTGTFHTAQSIEQMTKWLADAKRLYLQKFVNSGELLDNTVCGADDKTMEKYKIIPQKYIHNVQIRG